MELRGGAGKVAYLDTEGSFVPERIRPIAERFDLDPDAILENVKFRQNSLMYFWHHVLQEPGTAGLVCSWQALCRLRYEVSRRYSNTKCWLARHTYDSVCMQIVHARAYTSEQQMGELIGQVHSSLRRHCSQACNTSRQLC